VSRGFQNSLPLFSAGLSVLSFGAGQDSTAILYKLAYDADWRARYVGEDELIVVCADTGDEHRETYQHIREVTAFCSARGIRFEHLTPERGFHSQAWQSLIGQYRRNSTVGCKAYRKSCTDNLKIQPIYRFIESVLRSEYGLGGAGREPFSQFVRLHGKRIRMLLGIAAGEESRVADHSKLPTWMQDSVVFIYPLVEAGMNRAGCQMYIRSAGHAVPLPSNCRRCPYVSEAELAWLYRFDRAAYDEWVDLEKAKLLKFAHLGPKNYGVFGRRTLPQVLQAAQEKFGGWTDAQLWEHKMSHGHCVASRY
jgi:hypothetical protein